MLRELVNLWTQDVPLKQMGAKFQEMLQLGRRMLDLVTDTLFSDQELPTIRDELYAMDRRINALEQDIRKLILTKLTVEQQKNVATCLILFSVVKDAERCGDYAKNTYEVFVQAHGFIKDDYYSTLQEMRARVSYFFDEAATVFLESDRPRARKFLKKANEVAKLCDAEVAKIMQDEECTQAAAYVLLFRFFKRIVRHLMNIVSSVVMPVDKLDYFDEDYRTRLEEQIANGEATPGE